MLRLVEMPGLAIRRLMRGIIAIAVNKGFNHRNKRGLYDLYT
jgi:hypothetical protein